MIAVLAQEIVLAAHELRRCPLDDSVNLSWWKEGDSVEYTAAERCSRRRC
jgi:hypothetical protein